VSDEGDLIKSIRTIADYPKPGILFRDITTLLGDARAFRRAIDELVQPWAGTKVDKIAGIEARGFILGGAIAHQLSAGFVPIRKKGKLPHTKVSIAYSLEYGLDEMEMHEDAVTPGERVLLVDDLVATGGTAEGAVKLLKQIGADIVAACFVIDLPDLGGGYGEGDCGAFNYVWRTLGLRRSCRFFLGWALGLFGGTLHRRFALALASEWSPSTERSRLRLGGNSPRCRHVPFVGLPMP